MQGLKLNLRFAEEQFNLIDSTEKCLLRPWKVEVIWAAPFCLLKLAILFFKITIYLHMPRFALLCKTLEVEVGVLQFGESVVCLEGWKLGRKHLYSSVSTAAASPTSLLLYIENNFCCFTLRRAFHWFTSKNNFLLLYIEHKLCSHCKLHGPKIHELKMSGEDTLLSHN